MIDHHANWGEGQVCIQDPRGRPKWLPERWTSLCPTDPFQFTAKGRSAFRIAELRECAFGSLWTAFWSKPDSWQRLRHVSGSFVS